ncbi:MAG: hypothetical protein VXZ73_04450 [Pseudomonadota bacterium]|nr:hypothetical protein [Pseudomonadota bacterium]
MNDNSDMRYVINPPPDGMCSMHALLLVMAIHVVNDTSSSTPMLSEKSLIVNYMKSHLGNDLFIHQSKFILANYEGNKLLQPNISVKNWYQTSKVYRQMMDTFVEACQSVYSQRKNNFNVINKDIDAVGRNSSKSIYDQILAICESYVSNKNTCNKNIYAVDSHVWLNQESLDHLYGMLIHRGETISDVDMATLVYGVDDPLGIKIGVIRDHFHIIAGEKAFQYFCSDNSVTYEKVTENQLTTLMTDDAHSNVESYDLDMLIQNTEDTCSSEESYDLDELIQNTEDTCSSEESYDLDELIQNTEDTYSSVEDYNSDKSIQTNEYFFIRYGSAIAFTAIVSAVSIMLLSNPFSIAAVILLSIVASTFIAYRAGLNTGIDVSVAIDSESQNFSADSPSLRFRDDSFISNVDNIKNSSGNNSSLDVMKPKLHKEINEIVKLNKSSRNQSDLLRRCVDKSDNDLCQNSKKEYKAIKKKM